MSRIVRLKMKGFKSFANPTVLTFEDGFNTIVGANGSGKSNVFDALCFVLGRMSSKGLRAEKLGNLVFNGGKTSKPSREAEVSIFLSNENRCLLDTDLEEIKITRIVKKTGQSAYYLNNNKVTRTEIITLLKNASIDPDGYNIILQGDIMKIVNMTSNERRELIEEIANLSSYEDKRQQSLKKLEKIDIDLKNADLLLDEKTKYLKDLKSEKESAERYNKVKEDLRFNSLLLIKAKLIRNSKMRLKKREDAKREEIKLSEIKEKLEGIDEKIKFIDREITRFEKEIEINSHKDFISVSNKITSLEIELKKLKEKKADLNRLKKEILLKKESALNNIKINKAEMKKFVVANKELESKKRSLEREFSSMNKEYEILKKRFSKNDSSELDKINEMIDDLISQKEEEVSLKNDSLLQLERLNAKEEHLKEEIDKVRASIKENKSKFTELEKLRKRLKSLILDTSKLANKDSEISAKINSFQKEYNSLYSEYNKLRVKVETSKDIIAQNKAVSSILKFKNKDKGLFGTVADLASVPSEYSQALEILAGRSLFNIVVDTDSTAIKYIKYLKENRIGSVTFFPLNKIHAKFKLDSMMLNKRGVIDYALNLIKFDERFINIFHLIFQDALVIEKIDYAKDVGIGDYKMVTLDGDLILKSGAMSGGFRFKKRGMSVFKDDNSVKKLSQIEERISLVNEKIESLREEKRLNEQNLSKLREERVLIDSDIAKLESILSISNVDVDALNRSLKEITDDKRLIENSLKSSEKEILKIQNEIIRLQAQREKIKEKNSDSNIYEKVTKFEEKRDKLKNEISEIVNEINKNSIHHDKVIKPEIANLEKILVDSEKSLEEIALQIKDISEKIIVLDKDLSSLKKKERLLSKDYKDFIAKRDALKDKRKVFEKRYSRVYEGYEKLKEKVNKIHFEITELDKLYKNLEDELELLYEQIKIEFVAEDETMSEVESSKLEKLISNVDSVLKEKEINVKELQNRVNNLKSRINSFGSINLKAVKIYDKLKAEFDSLVIKRQSLTAEREEVLTFISEMDLKKKKRFLETFRLLQTNFSKVFNSLSTKGKAELILDDEEHIFENGVTIRVKMTEKNILDIKSLSGGEKSITAIAFIFAVQEFNPASFYIFDEVEAALDILNAEKLGKLISEYSKNAQYIVVSHNEHLIKSSEIIYGVTMDENKISNIVSLNLKEMTDYVEE